MAALLKDEQRTEELRTMGERVRLLSATIDALLTQMDEGSRQETGPAPPAKGNATGKRARPARARRS